MRIGIIGTRGIPNHYGGFEQFAEYAAPMLVDKGHEVYVYNSSSHTYREPSWKGVHIIRKWDPESFLGTAGQFIYDLNCILDSRHRNYDVILQLGYTSNSIWNGLLPRQCTIVTNMDGMEWKRGQYSAPVQRFLKKAERWAVASSHHLIADSVGIKEYLIKEYQRDSSLIAYGATLAGNRDTGFLNELGLCINGYNLVIARMEPENNIEAIIQAHVSAPSSPPLVLVGRYTNKLGKRLCRKYASERIRFLGPIFDLEKLNNLRYHAQLYFHGHSAGGTNPSLLEAMASYSLIVAHDNIFNRAVLGNHAFYFSSCEEIVSLLSKKILRTDYSHFIENNAAKIVSQYSWQLIVDLLEDCLVRAVQAEVPNILQADPGIY